MSRLTLALGLALLAVVGATTVGLALATAQEDAPLVAVALIAAVAAAFVVSGLVALDRRPDNRTGVYLAAVGFLGFVNVLGISANEWLFALGFALENLLWAPFGALVLAYPAGRLHGRLEHAIPVVTGVALTAGSVLVLLVVESPAPSRCEGCPDSPIALTDSPRAADAIDLVMTLVGLGIIATVLALLVRRWRAATPALRRLLWPVLAAGSATLLAIGLVVVADRFSRTVADVLVILLLVAFATVPLAFLFGVMRMRLARSSVADIVMALQRGTPLREALADALGDPSVEVVYRLDPGRGLGGAGWVDVEGMGVPAPAPEPGRALEYVEQDGVCVAALLHDASLSSEPELVQAVTAAAGIALHNERLQAELRAEVRLAGAFADTAPSLLSNVDTDGRILRLNLATLRASGYESEDELRGRFFWDVFIDPSEREEMLQRFRDAAPDFPPAEYENEFTNARGERLVIYWRSVPVLDEHGRVVSIVAGGLDITERKAREAEAELRRDFLWAITEAIPSFLIAVDPDGVIMEDGVNRAFEDVFGWSKEDLGGRSFLDLVSDEYQYGDRMAIANAANGVIQAERESWWLPRDGEPRAVAWTARPVLDPQGRDIVLVAGSDVTVRLRREEETRASEERFRAVIESAPVAIVEVGLDDAVQLWNPAAERIFGWTAEEAVGRPPPMVGPEHEEEFRTLLAHVRAGEAYTAYETKRRRKDGSLVDVAISVAPIYDAEEKVIGHMAVFVDISERKQRESEIRAERDFLNTIANSIPSLLTLVDADGVVTDRGVNRAFTAILGYVDDDVIGRPIFELLEPGEHGDGAAALRAAIGRDETSSGEGRWRARDGSTRLVEWTAIPTLDAADRRRWLVTGNDITERKQQEEEIRASRGRIVAAADDARRKLERNLHDGAQQRLVALSVSLRLAESKLKADPDAAAAILGSSREELTHALEDLRELARGIHPAVLSDRGLGAAVDALVARSPLPVDADVEGVQLPAAVEAAAYYVVAEALTNVVKYAKASSASVRIAQENGVLAVTVGDNGVGGADPANGSGLRGLADRVEALDGSLAVESPEGGGTAVRAEIPIAVDAE